MHVWKWEQYFIIYSFTDAALSVNNPRITALGNIDTISSSMDDTAAFFLVTLTSLKWQVPLQVLSLSLMLAFLFTRPLVEFVKVHIQYILSLNELHFQYLNFIVHGGCLPFSNSHVFSWSSSMSPTVGNVVFFFWCTAAVIKSGFTSGARRDSNVSHFCNTGIEYSVLPDTNFD